MSEGGFRYFLPDYLIADLQDRLQSADPRFHLANGFRDKVVKIPAGQRIYEKTIAKSAFVNPSRYGAMTSHDHARTQLSVFTREEPGCSMQQAHQIDRTDQMNNSGWRIFSVFC
ncbi:MAG: hypothetical protein ABI604_07210 [Nitrospirota bacterium]